MKSCFIIAEAGVNHNGDLAMAKQLVDVAVESGADAVKFQTFRAESLVTSGAERAAYQKQNMGGDESQFEMLKKLELSFEDFRILKKYCDGKKIEFLSTPFDEECARFLVEDLGMARVKIPSGELTNLPYLQVLASFQKPMILSTGMSDLQEVRQAVSVIEKISEVSLTILHCTTNYPCLFEEVNLRALQTLRETFRRPVGYSDHTLGIEVAIAAVALGASVIEKHVTLSRTLKGPDHRCSLEPEEFKKMVESIRHIEKALGTGEKKPTSSEMEMRKLARRSLVFSRSLSAGTTLCREDLLARRAGEGVAPQDLEKLVGLKLKVNKKSGDMVSWDDVQ